MGVAAREVLTKVDLAESEDARERRRDRLSLDRRTYFSDAGRHLFVFGRGAVELGARDDVVLQQTFHSREVGPSQVSLRFGRGELRALLARVELHQHVAFTNGLS